MTDETFPIVNDHGTVMEVTEERFKKIKAVDGSGYRKLKAGELPPLQASELPVREDGTLVPASTAIIGAENIPSADRMKQLRRQMAKDDGAK